MTDLKAEARRLAEELNMDIFYVGHSVVQQEKAIKEALLAFGRLVREEDIKFLEEHDWRKLCKDKALE